MNILITGGGGFIGSYLTEELVNRKDNICVVDDFSTGNTENIKHLIGKSNFTFINGSVLDKDLMSKLIDKSDAIYHLAAAVGVKYIMENQLKSIHLNVYGTEIILELASKRKQKVMISSSSEVYGKNGQVPYSEDSDRLMGPTTTSRWSYACAKALDEFMALAYFREKGLPIIIPRFFNICGPKQTGQYGMVIPRFVKNALLGEPIIIYGDGEQSRCFTYVGDAVRAMIMLMETDDAVGQVFNVGSTQEIKIIDLAKKVIELTKSNSKIEFIPYKDIYGEDFDDMRRRIPDISKIFYTIGWKPSVDLDELLQKIIENESFANMALFESNA